jgi:hypothetical protein
MGKKRNKYTWSRALATLKQVLTEKEYQIVVASKGKSFDETGKDQAKELVIEMFRNYKQRNIDLEAFKRIIITNIVAGALHRNFIQRIETSRERQGYAIISHQASKGDEYGSTYTTGLSGSLGYDLIVINNAHPTNRHEVIQATLLSLHDQPTDVDVLDGAVITFESGDRVELIKVETSTVVDKYAPYLTHFSKPGDQINLLQVVYPNTAGKLPSDEGYKVSSKHPVFKRV